MDKKLDEDLTQPNVHPYVKSTTTSTDSAQCCDYYQEGMDKINGFIITASVRAGENMYDGKPFIYCPWCGKNTRGGA